MPQYAITDIHGHLKTFRTLLKTLDFNREDELFLLGDFIDRGPASKGVIDHIENLRGTGHRVYCLRGNHEQLALDAEYGNNSWRSWLAHGGKETCTSFGTYGEWIIPPAYREWMEALPLHLSTEGYLMVHAGLDTTRKEPLQDAESLLWARNWYRAEDTEWLAGRTLLHGHTPVTQGNIHRMVSRDNDLQIINIDNGCYGDANKGYGHLCALRLGSHDLTFQLNIDR